MLKIVLIGRKKEILGFRALGVDTFGIGNENDVIEAVGQIKAKGYAIVFIMEDVSQQYDKYLKDLYFLPATAVTVIPSAGPATGKGLENLRIIARRALGSDILKI